MVIVVVGHLPPCVVLSELSPSLSLHAAVLYRIHPSVRVRRAHPRRDSLGLLGGRQR